MSSYTSIPCEKLARLIGTAKVLTLISVRLDKDFAADPDSQRDATLAQSPTDWAPWIAATTASFPFNMGMLTVPPRRASRASSYVW